MPSLIAKTTTGIGNLNTRINNNVGEWSVTLYDTLIYAETDKTITLNNGGWITPTTVRRMNQALTHRGYKPLVRIKKGQMFYGLNEFTACIYSMTKAVNHA